MRLFNLRPLLISSLSALVLPGLALAERVVPLAPAQQFDPLAVPLPPVQATPPVRVPAPQPPIIVVPAPGWQQTAPPPPQVRIQAPSPTPAPPEAGADLIERGAGILLDNLLTEMQPTFEEMARGLDGVANKFGPALEDLGSLVDDIHNYQTPERLPNGDILIRRRADAPPPPASNALRDLTTPQDTPGTTPPATSPPGTVQPTTPPAPMAPDTTAPNDPPPLAAPIPSVLPGTQIEL
ncbi:hypothetical protein [Paracoccus suum]|nr:hypothetical protein [Paracoccus suum]